MPNHILTGAPGSGKTALLRQLELAGHAVVEEAATDVIALQHALGRAEPWQDPAFLEHIVSLQRRRELAAASTPGSTFFDRSPVCTLALSRYLGVPAPPSLISELNRIRAERVFEPAVFFVRNQGLIERTAARRITFAQSLIFERIHEETYLELGYALVEVPPAPLLERAELVQKT